MPNSVVLLADDLTGALDAVAPFADHSPVRAFPIVWTADAARGWPAPIALSMETRAPAPKAAGRRVRAALASVPDADIRFKKIDSFARGNTAEEIAACAARDRAGTVLVAPAVTRPA